MKLSKLTVREILDMSGNQPRQRPRIEREAHGHAGQIAPDVKN